MLRSGWLYQQLLVRPVSNTQGVTVTQSTAACHFIINRSGTKARATSLSSLCPVMPTRERHLHGAWILMKQINPFLQHIFTLRLCFHCRPSAATLSNLKEVIKGVWSSLVVPWMFTLSSFSWMGAGTPTTGTPTMGAATHKLPEHALLFPNRSSLITFN